VFILGAIAFSIYHIWRSRRLVDRAAVLLILLALTASSLEYRFAYRHEKDDNRDAVAIAKAALAQGDNVWWAADQGCATYYALPFTYEPVAGSALIVWKPEPLWLAGLKAPTLIVFSKPDIFDENGGLREYIQQHGYMETGSLPAFTFWRK